MSVTITLHLWWLGVYLAAGLVLWLPLEWLANRQIANPKPPFWQGLRAAVGRHPLRVLVPIAAWPVAMWEVLR